MRASGLRLGLLLALSGWYAVLSADASAQVQQTSRAKPDTAIPAAAVQSERVARPERHTLSTDGLEGTVTVLRTGQPFPVGGSAFAQIKVSNKTKRKSVDAELVLKAETAAILNVSGSRLDIRDHGGERVARLKQVRKGRPRTVTVEMKLQEPGTPGENGLQNKLHVTLRTPGGTGETTTLGWDVANCAGGFYSEIVKVREGSGAGISEALKAVRTRDKSRPGRWLFPPKLGRARAKRRCVRRVRRWSYQRGRYVYRCTRYRTIRPKPAVVSGAAPVEYERSVFRFAGSFVRSRTLDSALDRRRDTGWATHRVSQNLKGFLQQDSTPAICTGAIQFFNYFDDKMTGFVKRTEKFDDMADKSQRLAVLRTEEALTAARIAEAKKAEPGGHPGWGTEPLDLPQAPEREGPKHQIEKLAQTTGDAQLGQRVANAEDTFSALKIMSRYYRSDAGKALDKTARAAMYRALSAIEAADYIGAVDRRYSDLHHALIGSMETLRQAHSRSCTCDG